MKQIILTKLHARLFVDPTGQQYMSLFNTNSPVHPPSNFVYKPHINDEFIKDIHKLYKELHTPRNGVAFYSAMRDPDDSIYIKCEVH